MNMPYQQPMMNYTPNYGTYQYNPMASYQRYQQPEPTQGISGRVVTVIKRVYRNNSKRVYWKCRCVCGKETIVESSKLKGGYTKSCGCLNNENRKRHINELTTHNMSNTKLFDVWCSMRSRCENRKNKSYKWYGAKGVRVCDEWIGKDGFQNFYNWSIKNGYKDGLWSICVTWIRVKVKCTTLNRLHHM